jgi:alpha/beta superfamily hydrolase
MFPVVVIPGAEHFFHGRLHILKRIIQKAYGPVITPLQRN